MLRIKLEFFGSVFVFVWLYTDVSFGQRRQCLMGLFSYRRLYCYRKKYCETSWYSFKSVLPSFTEQLEFESIV